MFISKSIVGTVYVAEHRHHRFRCFRYPEGAPVEAGMVPRLVRKRAYKMFELDRRRMRKIIALAAVLVVAAIAAVPASAGDYAAFKCGNLKVIFTYADDREDSENWVQVRPPGTKEKDWKEYKYPHPLFRLVQPNDPKAPSDVLYYRGQRCRSLCYFGDCSQE
jgi:hypothetical protein